MVVVVLVEKLGDSEEVDLGDSEEVEELPPGASGTPIEIEGDGELEEEVEVLFVEVLFEDVEGDPFC